MDNQNTNQPNLNYQTPAPSFNPSPEPPKKKMNFKPLLIGLAVTLLVAGIFALIFLDYKNINKKQDKAAQETAYKDLDDRLKAIEDNVTYFEKEIDQDKYQAVFLDNGQVYFGKITEVKHESIKLEDIYYLKSGKVDKNGNPTGPENVSLIKLGNELHAPEDTMYIQRAKLSFWENLKTNGQVTKAIKDYKQSNPGTQ